MGKSPEILTVPPGAEINCGLSEDSDSVVARTPTKLLVIGPRRNGAIPVRILEDDDRPGEDIYYYHQPEDGSS